MALLALFENPWLMNCALILNISKSMPRILMRSSLVRLNGLATWEICKEAGWETRPISDIVVKFEPLMQTYGSGEATVSPITEFRYQLKMMMARYRIGNGTGAAIVSPAQSCVQDSNQALYRAIQEIEEKSEEAPQLRQLAALGAALEQELTPLGLVRSDWKTNTDTLVGSPPTQNQLLNLIRGLLSWRTMLPRRAHDELARVFLKQGAQLWFIRANQIGGIDSTIVPYAPTTIIPGR